MATRTEILVLQIDRRSPVIANPCAAGDVVACAEEIEPRHSRRSYGFWTEKAPVQAAYGRAHRDENQILLLSFCQKIRGNSRALAVGKD